MENSYYKLSKKLFENEEYKDLSSNSKIAYSILNYMINDMSNDKRKIDDKNNLYLINSREVIQDKLGVSINTITKIYKELSATNLIIEKIAEEGKGKVVYIKFITNDEEDIKEVAVQVDSREGNKQEGVAEELPTKELNPYKNIIRAILGDGGKL